MITILEHWTDRCALKAHLGTAHMQSYREAVKAIVKKTSVRIFRQAEVSRPD